MMQKKVSAKKKIPYARLYIFYPISKDHFFVFKEVFSENSVLMYDLYSRVARTVILFKGKGGQFQP